MWDYIRCLWYFETTVIVLDGGHENGFSMHFKSERDQINEVGGV